VKASDTVLTDSKIMKEALYMATRYKNVKMYKEIAEDLEWLPNLRRKYGLMTGKQIHSMENGIEADIVLKQTIL